jgi:hypothetical protein
VKCPADQFQRPPDVRFILGGQICLFQLTLDVLEAVSEALVGRDFIGKEPVDFRCGFYQNRVSCWPGAGSSGSSGSGMGM